MDRILFIDGHNAIHRACIKFGKPSDPSSENNVAPVIDDSIVFAFNFFRNLRPIIEKFSPDKCFFVLEGHPQFRYDLYPEYKANRIIKRASGKSKESEDKFIRTKDIVLPLLKHLPITTCRANNYEADDLIGTLADNMKEEDLTILSNDSDFIQLLQRGYSNITIYNPIKKVNMEAPPYLYIQSKAIKGDKSDNIKALLKPKKAQAVIDDPELFRKFMELEENRANFSINRQLIEFRTVPDEEIILAEGARNFHELRHAFAEMKFESIINFDSWGKYTKTFDCLKY